MNKKWLVVATVAVVVLAFAGGALVFKDRSAQEVKQCLRQPDLAALQIIFNIFRQKPIHTLFAAAKKQNVALIVRLPLASGLARREDDGGDDLCGERSPEFQRRRPEVQCGRDVCRVAVRERRGACRCALKPLVPAGMTLPELALRWCLDFDAVSVLIPGAKNPEQARANTRAAALPRLSVELHATLAEFYARDVAAEIRGTVLRTSPRRLSFPHAPPARRRLSAAPA